MSISHNLGKFFGPLTLPSNFSINLICLNSSGNNNFVFTNKTAFINSGKFGFGQDLER
ncbi:uncharacterized protein METZ01_LOCUS246092 [marine metagenome]|uniref:Uncharacterized protein n=1 Tax=marine metagenome TaxID=408172 RepID=A0A382I116_9ZZZZ